MFLSYVSQAAEIQTAATATHRKLRTELKAVRLTACVVGAVVVLWTPYLVGNLILIGGINPILGQYVTDIGTALGSATSSINWIIYGLASRDFRHSALRLFRYHRQTVDSGTNDSNINADIVTPDITLSRVSKDRVTPSHPITLSSDARLEASNSMMSHV